LTSDELGGKVGPLSGKKWGEVGLCGMFLGTFQLKLDEKGRLSIPARYRDILQHKYQPGPQQTEPDLILCSIGPRISAYPWVVWERMADALDDANALPGLHQEARDLDYVLSGNAAECTIDTQGRVLIPPHLRTKGKLNSEVTIIGLRRYFEIWDRATWEEYEVNCLRGREEEVAQKVADLRDTRLVSRLTVFDDGSRGRL
jgi:MraZ protein